jgi:hypothetical protein
MILWWIVVVVAAATDPLYEHAWHLHSVDGSQSHLNVESVWGRQITGRGVTILTAGGLPSEVESDLDNKKNEKLNLHTNPNIRGDSQALFSVSEKNYLLAVGIGANNHLCSRGVAYNAQYAIVDETDTGAIDCQWISLAIQDKNGGHIAVIDYDASHLPGHRALSPLCHSHTQDAYDAGLLVLSKSGDIESNCNVDNYLNSPWTITVASYTDDYSPSPYLNQCANALISAPGGNSQHPIAAAVGNGECDENFGSQVALMNVAGVVALMMEASESHLSPRDITHILVETAQHPNTVEWKTNGAGILYHPFLGLGMIDASAAVSTATSYTPLYGRIHEHFTNLTQHTTIPPKSSISSSVFVLPTVTGILESVSVWVSITHSKPSSLSISLNSPSLTTAYFTQPTPANVIGYMTIKSTFGSTTAKIWSRRSETSLQSQTSSQLWSVHYMTAECCLTSTLCRSSLTYTAPFHLYLIDSTNCSVLTKLQNARTTNVGMFVWKNEEHIKAEHLLFETMRSIAISVEADFFRYELCVYLYFF